MNRGYWSGTGGLHWAGDGPPSVEDCIDPGMPLWLAAKVKSALAHPALFGLGLHALAQQCVSLGFPIAGMCLRALWMKLQPKKAAFHGSTPQYDHVAASGTATDPSSHWTSAWANMSAEVGPSGPHLQMHHVNHKLGGAGQWAPASMRAMTTATYHGSHDSVGCGCGTCAACADRIGKGGGAAHGSSADREFDHVAAASASFHGHSRAPKYPVLPQPAVFTPPSPPSWLRWELPNWHGNQPTETIEEALEMAGEIVSSSQSVVAARCSGWVAVVVQIGDSGGTEIPIVVWEAKMVSSPPWRGRSRQHCVLVRTK